MLWGRPRGVPSSPDAVSESASVHFTRCAFASDHLFTPLVGLHVSGSQASLWGSSVHGQSGDPSSGADGNAALQAWDSVVFASGTELRGGDGGSGGMGAFQPCEGGDGAPALLVGAPGAPASLHLLDSSTAGGAGGAGISGCPDGAPAPPSVVEAGSSLAAIPGDARSSELDALAVEGQVLGGALRGVPGDAAFLAWSLGAAPGPFVPAWHGTAFLAPPIGVLPAGLVPASGEIALAVAIPHLGLGDGALPLLGHGVFVAASGAIHLGSPTIAVLAGAGALP